MVQKNRFSIQMAKNHNTETWWLEASEQQKFARKVKNDTIQINLLHSIEHLHWQDLWIKSQRRECDVEKESNSGSVHTGMRNTHSAYNRHTRMFVAELSAYMQKEK